jgi:hypothetical protein
MGRWEAVPPRLVEIIRDKLDAGLLPRRQTVKTWAGYGRSQPCSACDAPILPTQTEYEFDGGARPAYRFHVGCYGLWEAERRRRGLPKGRPPVEPRVC